MSICKVDELAGYSCSLLMENFLFKSILVLHLKFRKISRVLLILSLLQNWRYKYLNVLYYGIIQNVYSDPRLGLLSSFIALGDLKAFCPRFGFPLGLHHGLLYPKAFLRLLIAQEDFPSSPDQRVTEAMALAEEIIVVDCPEHQAPQILHERVPRLEKRKFKLGCERTRMLNIKFRLAPSPLC